MTVRVSEEIEKNEEAAPDDRHPSSENTFHIHVHVHHNVDPFNPVLGQIDLIGLADKVAAVKEIVDNIPWTLTNPLEKGFIGTNLS